jgi:nitroreductase
MSNQHKRSGNVSAIDVIEDLVLYPRGTYGFQDRAVVPDTLETILKAVTPYVSLSKWRLLAVRNRENRIALLEAMQAAYEKLEKPRWAETMNRWKHAPVILVFCLPNEVRDFGGVPADAMRSMALIELGIGVQSLILTARAHGVETHWIASAVLTQDAIREQLDVPDDYTIVFFGIAGYPSEEIDQPFAQLSEVCFGESWGSSYRH